MAKTNPEWIRYIELVNKRPGLFVNNGMITIELNEDIVSDFEIKSGKKVGVVYESPYSMMIVDLVYNNPNEYYLYERLIPHSDKNGVVIIPVHEGKIVLLNQYRHALRDYQISLPRGYGEDGIISVDNVSKELDEEIGAKATNITFLGTINANSGSSGGFAEVYSCEIDTYVQKHGYEGIDSVIELTTDELKDYIRAGKINDGFTLSAMCYYWNGKK